MKNLFGFLMNRFVTRINTAIYYFKKESKLQFFCRVLRFMICKYVNLGHLLKLQLLKARTKDRHILKEILGSNMLLDLNDQGISLDLLMNGIRETLATEVTKKIIKKGDVIIDIGANIGYYALLESRLAGPTGKVFAIEPVNENIKQLKKNIELNKYSNIEAFQLAIGDKDKKGFIYLSDRSNWCSMNYLEYVKVNKKIKKEVVEVMTLDRFLEDKPFPDLIRIDVEGYEYEILKGMQNLLKTNRPLKIFLEIHVTDDLREKMIENVDTLFRHGFKFKIGAWKDLRSRSNLLKSIYNFLSRKIDPNSVGYFYTDNPDDLKSILNKKEIFPQVLFERE